MVKVWMVFGRPPLIFNDVVKYLNIRKYNTTYCSSNTEVLREYSFGKNAKQSYTFRNEGDQVWRSS